MASGLCLFEEAIEIFLAYNNFNIRPVHVTVVWDSSLDSNSDIDLIKALTPKFSASLIWSSTIDFNGQTTSNGAFGPCIKPFGDKNYESTRSWKTKLFSKPVGRTANKSSPKTSYLTHASALTSTLFPAKFQSLFLALLRNSIRQTNTILTPLQTEIILSHCRCSS